MEITVFLENEYTPEWNGNKEKAKPIIIEHREPSMKLQSQLLQKPQVRFKIGADGTTEGGEADATIDPEKIVKGMVTGIRNLDIKRVQKSADGKENIRSVVTAADLFTDWVPASLSGLVNELAKYFQAILQKDVDSKNSE